MGRDLNSVNLIGRLTRDPEMRNTADGTAVVNFSLANNQPGGKGKDDIVNYFDVIVWGNQALNCEKYLQKGSLVAITGSLKQNTWVDQQTNKKRSKIEITAFAVQFLTAPQNQNENNAGANQASSNTNQPQRQPAQNGGRSNPRRQQNNPGNNQGFVQDPWADQGSNNNANNNSNNNDNDIPF